MSPLPFLSQSDPDSTLPLLFDILDLLPNLLELALNLHGLLRKLCVVHFGTDGINLPMDLLEEKIHLSTDRFFTYKQGSKLGQMTLCPNQLFRDIGPFHPEGNLLAGSGRDPVPSRREANGAFP